MKSWAHTYMAGSLLGTVLIVAALVAFVPLVSLSAPDEWPTPSLGLDAGGGRGDVGVGAAVVAAAKHSQAAGANPNPAGGGSAAAGTPNVAIGASGQRLHTESPGGAEAGAPAKEIVAVSPASAEVVAHNPGLPTSEGGVDTGSPPSPTESGSAPVPTVTDGEGEGIGDPGETPSTTPIEAGVEGPGSQPPERPESVPPPPSGNSIGGSEVPDCAEVGNEDEAAQEEYDPSLPAPGLVDVSLER